jgi:hypothetical protein
MSHKSFKIMAHELFKTYPNRYLQFLYFYQILITFKIALP